VEGVYGSDLVIWREQSVVTSVALTVLIEFIKQIVVTQYGYSKEKNLMTTLIHFTVNGLKSKPESFRVDSCLHSTERDSCRQR
jgi:hypothetical protein